MVESSSIRWAASKRRFKDRIGVKSACATPPPQLPCPTPEFTLDAWLCKCCVRAGLLATWADIASHKVGHRTRQVKRWWRFKRRTTRGHCSACTDAEYRTDAQAYNTPAVTQHEAGDDRGNECGRGYGCAIRVTTHEHMAQANSRSQKFNKSSNRRPSHREALTAFSCKQLTVAVHTVSIAVTSHEPVKAFTWWPCYMHACGWRAGSLSSRAPRRLLPSCCESADRRW